MCGFGPQLGIQTGAPTMTAHGAKASRTGELFGRGSKLWAAAAMAALVLIASAWAKPAADETKAQSAADGKGHNAAQVEPNYELEARFLPEEVSKLVFDVAVTPHWFTESDRFWYSYQTTDGTRYWVVDPVKRTKTPLWDNAKVAATLSTLTNFPYDAQHLPVKRLKLIDKDTKMQFAVEIRKDAVVPNEQTKEKSQEDVEEAGKEGQEKQGERQGAAQASAGANRPEDTRTIYFEYELATGKITRLDNYEAPKKKPMWASVSPDGKTVVFARGHNLYFMDADNYAKALKKAGDASVTETQLTTDGMERYSYARLLLPEQEEQQEGGQGGHEQGRNSNAGDHGALGEGLDEDCSRAAG